MREIRTYGSEGGEAPQGAFPTLISPTVFKLRIGFLLIQITADGLCFAKIERSVFHGHIFPERNQRFINWSIFIGIDFHDVIIDGRPFSCKVEEGMPCQVDHCFLVRRCFIGYRYLIFSVEGVANIDAEISRIAHLTIFNERVQVPFYRSGSV